MVAPEQRARKRQRTAQSGDASDGKKQRGRPRVEAQDETAADRRRTQIRLAQRAYRLRKETTISSLKEQVTSLHNTIEQMNKAFLQFNDEAMSSGLLQQRPELARLLKATTEEFILLTKAAGQAAGDQPDSEADDDQIIQQASSRRVPQSEHNENWLDDRAAALPAVELPRPRTNSTELPMGYVQVMDDNSDSLMTPPVDTGFDTDQPMGLVSASIAPYEPVYTLPTTSASSVLDKIMPTQGWSQNHRADVEVIDQTPSRTSLPSPQKFSTLSPHYTYSFQETTFARRLQRATLERSYHLLSQAHIRPAAFTRVFRLSLLYLSRDQLLQKFRTHLTGSTMKPLETYSMPFIHLGGAGMHYQKGRIENGYIIKQGPIMRRARIEPADRSDVGYDVDIDLKEYDGEWFDANDVEGYLEEKGVSIEPQSSFAEAEISTDLIPVSVYETSGIDAPAPAPLSPASIPDAPPHPPSRTTRYSSASPRTPPAPLLNETSLELGASRLFPELMALEGTVATALETTATGWLFGSGDKTPDFLSSGWAEVQPPSSWEPTDAVAGFEGWNLAELPASALVPGQQQLPPRKRTVTIDVNKLVDELIKHGICLGRAPGFRKKDVDRALQSAIIQVF